MARGITLLSLALSLLIVGTAEARWVTRVESTAVGFDATLPGDCGKLLTDTTEGDSTDIGPDVYAETFKLLAPKSGTVIKNDVGQPVATVESVNIARGLYGEVAVTVKVDQASCDPATPSWSQAVDVTWQYRTIVFMRCRHIAGSFGGASMGVHGGATCSAAREVVRAYIGRVIRTRRTTLRVKKYACEEVGSGGEVSTVDCWRGGKLVHFTWGV